MTRFKAGARIASVDQSGSGKTSSIRFHGKPRGIRNERHQEDARQWSGGTTKKTEPADDEKPKCQRIKGGEYDHD
jgi:hypothetical protein